MYICCLIQAGHTPLQVAIRNNANEVVYLLMINHNQQTSHLSQVKIIIILFIMIATIAVSNHVVPLTSLPINCCCSDNIQLHCCFVVLNIHIYSCKLAQLH